VQRIEQQLIAELKPLQDMDLVKQVRVKGAIGVIELNKTFDDQMHWLPEFIVDQGVWIRPFRNLVYIMPPYIIDTTDLTTLTKAMGAIVQKLATILK